MSPLWSGIFSYPPLCCLNRCFLCGWALWNDEDNLHPSLLGCELSSSPRAEGGAGHPLDGHTFAWTAPPLAEGGEKRRPGQPSPTVGSGAVCTMAWTTLLLVLLSYCTGRDRIWTPLASSNVTPIVLGILINFTLASAPSPMDVHFCRFLLPACADSAALPLCISWSHRKTHLCPQ